MVKVQTQVPLEQSVMWKSIYKVVLRFNQLNLQAFKNRDFPVLTFIYYKDPLLFNKQPKNF